MKLPISDLTKVDLTEWHFEFGDGLDVIAKALDEHIREQSEIELMDFVDGGLTVSVSLPLGNNENMGIVHAEIPLASLIDEWIADESNGAADLEEVAAQLRTLADRLDKAVTAPAPKETSAT